MRLFFLLLNSCSVRPWTLHSNSTGTWTECLWTRTQDWSPVDSESDPKDSDLERGDSHSYLVDFTALVIISKFDQWPQLHSVVYHRRLTMCSSVRWLGLQFLQINTTLILLCLELVYMDHNWWGSSKPGGQRVGSESKVWWATEAECHWSPFICHYIDWYHVHGIGWSCSVTEVIVIIIINHKSHYAHYIEWNEHFSTSMSIIIFVACVLQFFRSVWRLWWWQHQY